MCPGCCVTVCFRFVKSKCNRYLFIRSILHRTFYYSILITRNYIKVSSSVPFINVPMVKCLFNMIYLSIDCKTSLQFSCEVNQDFSTVYLFDATKANISLA